MISRLARRRTLVLALIAQLGGACTASPPARDDYGPDPARPTPFGARATCTTIGYEVPSCPGTLCADNVLGPPDGKTADLTLCFALDVAFVGGSAVAPARPVDPGQEIAPALRVTFGTIAGATRVEASADGTRYTLVGYVVDSPASFPYLDSNCFAKVLGRAAELKLNYVCSTIGEARYLRFSADDRSSGRATIDAVEAISWKSSY